MSLLTLFRGLAGRPAARLVVTASILDGDRLVMVREGRAHKRGEWNLPSGRVDRGEHLVDAAIREAKEESGLDVRILSIAGIHLYPSGSGEDVVRFNFVAEAIGGSLAADGSEIVEVRWMTFQEIETLPNGQLRSAPTIRRIIADLRSNHRFPLEMIHERR